MGKCKNCNADISDDKELCDNCRKIELDENNSKESYLDELLNSVVSTQSVESENNGNIRKRRLEQRSKESFKEKQKESSKDSSEQMIHDKVNQDILKNNEEQGEMVENMMRREEDDLQDLMNMESIDMDPIEMDLTDIDNTDSIGMEPISMDHLDEQELDDSEDQSYDINNIFDFMDMVGENSENIDWSSANDNSNNNSNEFETTPEDSFSDNLNNDLGSNIDTIGVLDNNLDSSSDNNDDENNNKDINDTTLPEDDILTEESEDINQLLDFLSNEENAVSLDLSNEDMKNVNVSDFGNEDENSFENYKNDNSSPSLELGSDIGDVFSDTLGAVTTLEDPNLMEDLSSIIVPETTEEDKVKKIIEKENKRGIFKELFFGSEEDDLETDVIVEKKTKNKKSKKDKRAKNNVKSTTTNDGSEGEKKGFLDFLKKKNTKNTAKNIKTKKAVKTKKPKKEKEEEVEIDRGKINKYAAMIIFSIFAALAIVIISGTEIISYSSSISTATVEFKRQRYNYAYEALNGMEVKDKDMELYDKVMTVMFVNKQLNSYNNFYSMGEYTQALDSLLKGLKRYDKYIALAKELGIESDLNYVRDQILSELKKSYQLSEEEALDILKSEDQTSYSIKLYDTVNKTISIAEKGKK